MSKYFYCWALILPVSSYVVITSIKGTTPGNLFALLSFFVVICFAPPSRKGLYLKQLLLFIIVFIWLSAISQLALSFSPLIDFKGLKLVDMNDASILFRSTFYTQSIYLFAGFLTFIFVRTFYSSTWDKSIFTGAILLALYGIYTVIYYLLFKSNGDFISNRVFGDGAGGISFQLLDLGAIIIQRLQSLTAEPSMYAFTILPFWIYAVHAKKTKIHILLLFTLVLSTSTSAVIGISLYLLLRVYYFKLRDKFTLYIIGCFAFVFLLFPSIVITFYQKMIHAKFTLVHVSGMERFTMIKNNLVYFWDSSIFIKLFGVGFGYIRSTDMLTTLLVNNGVFGLLIVGFVFIFPLVKLGNSYREIGLKSSLIIILTVMLISVSEFSYLSIWLFLGIAYNEIWQRKRERVNEVYIY